MRTSMRFAAQYVTQTTDPTATATFGARHVFAELIEHQVSATLRLNATFSPTLSFQLYAQPFTFTGAYRGFKELGAPQTFTFNTYGRDNGSTVTPGDTAVCAGAGPTQCSGVDPDGAGPAKPFALYNPDFRTRSLSIKAVWRWEYRPGSTVIFAWTHSRSGYFQLRRGAGPWTRAAARPPDQRRPRQSQLLAEPVIGITIDHVRDADRDAWLRKPRPRQSPTGRA